MTKVYTVDEIRDLLDRSDEAVIRGLLRIYERQTFDEQKSEFTKHDNGIGFSAADGHILSSFAKQVKKHQIDPNPRYKTPLSPKQMAMARARIRKYARQLCEIANQQTQVS